MLRMFQNNQPARAKSYYATADYYTEGQELTGRWRGEGALATSLRRTCLAVEGTGRRYCGKRDNEVLQAVSEAAQACASNAGGTSVVRACPRTPHLGLSLHASMRNRPVLRTCLCGMTVTGE